MLHHAYNDYYFRNNDRKDVPEMDKQMFHDNALWLINNFLKIHAAPSYTLRASRYSGLSGQSIFSCSAFVTQEGDCYNPLFRFSWALACFCSALFCLDFRCLRRHLFQNISSFQWLKSLRKMMPMPWVVRLVRV